MSDASLRKGYILGLSAYVMWGFFPLFFHLLDQYSAIEIIAQRALWSALFGALILCFWRHPNWWKTLLSHPARVLVLALSGLLIATNWTVYVWAVNNQHLIEASLGYYINPLVNVLLGLVVLRERLRPLQWVAVGFAAVGVLLQVIMLGKMPWISLALALSFALYGLVRRQVQVAALPGLVVETWLLLPLALAWLGWFGTGSTTQLSTWSHAGTWLLALTGPITIIPLLCFNAAARSLPYSTLGFLQYIAPSIVLLLALTVFNEPFPQDKQLSFALIFAGLIVYTFDSWRLLRKSNYNLKTSEQ